MKNLISWSKNKSDFYERDCRGIVKVKYIFIIVGWLVLLIMH